MRTFEDKYYRKHGTHLPRIHPPEYFYYRGPGHRRRIGFFTRFVAGVRRFFRRVFGGKTEATGSKKTILKPRRSANVSDVTQSKIIRQTVGFRRKV